MVQSYILHLLKMFIRIKKKFKSAMFSNIYLEHFYHFMALKIFQKRNMNFPFGKRNKNLKVDYLNLFNQTKNTEYDDVISFEKLTEYQIDKEWLNDLALLTQVTLKNSEICYAHGRVLYSALSRYLKDTEDNFINVIETGTSKGFSSLCMAKALNDHNYDGIIRTIDIIPSNKEIYWNNISDFDGKKTRFNMLEKWSDLIDKYIIYIEGTSKKILKKLIIDRVNFAFLDGSHTYYDVLNEFKYVADRQISGDIIIVDDYNKQYKGLMKASDKLSLKYNYKQNIVNSSTNRSYLICQKI